MDESDTSGVDPKNVDPKGHATSSTRHATPEQRDATPEQRTDPVRDKERVFVGTGVFVGLVVGLVLAVIMIILAAQNTDSTTVKFLVWDYSTPLFVLILAALLAGVIIDELGGLFYRHRRRRTLTERHELKRLQDKPR